MGLAGAIACLPPGDLLVKIFMICVGVNSALDVPHRARLTLCMVICEAMGGVIPNAIMRDVALMVEIVANTLVTMRRSPRGAVRKGMLAITLAIARSIARYMENVWMTPSVNVMKVTPTMIVRRRYAKIQFV